MRAADGKLRAQVTWAEVDALRTVAAVFAVTHDAFSRRLMTCFLRRMAREPVLAAPNCAACQSGIRVCCHSHPMTNLMSPRFVLLPPENEFNRGQNLSGRLLMARLKLRDGPTGHSVGGMAMVGGSMVPLEAIERSAASSRVSYADLQHAENSGPPLPPCKVVKRLPDDDGAMLIDGTDEDRLALQTAYPGARFVVEGIATMAHMTIVLQELAAMGAASFKSALPSIVCLSHPRSSSVA